MALRLNPFTGEFDFVGEGGSGGGGGGGGAPALVIAPASVNSNTAYTIPSDKRLYSVIRLTGNATITLPNPTLEPRERYALVVELTQDGTGSRTVTWAAPAGKTIKWLSSATAHPLVTAANKVNWVRFDYPQEQTVIYASVVWQESQL